MVDTTHCEAFAITYHRLADHLPYFRINPMFGKNYLPERIVDWKAYLQDTSITPATGGFMITHFHGVDKHSTHLTITTVDLEGQFVRYLSRCTKFSDFIDTLSQTDAFYQTIEKNVQWA